VVGGICLDKDREERRPLCGRLNIPEALSSMQPSTKFYHVADIFVILINKPLSPPASKKNWDSGSSASIYYIYTIRFIGKSFLF
jgi:hypothetical protein